MIIEDKVFQLYVGANNLTGVVELETAREVLEFNGLHAWTETQTNGVWRGRPEPSVILTVSTSEGTAVRTARQLRDVLNQDAVGIVQLSTMPMTFA